MNTLRKYVGWAVYALGLFFILTTLVSLFTDGFWDFLGNAVITTIVIVIGKAILPQSEIDKIEGNKNPESKRQTKPPKNESLQQKLNREFEEKRLNKIAEKKKDETTTPTINYKSDDFIYGSKVEYGDPFELIYRDADGNRSRRAITFHELEQNNGNEYIIAFCDSRQDIRTFRVDRVESLTNLATGEIII